MSEEDKEKEAIQFRCVFCKKEQYLPAVHAISKGEHPCVWCGKIPGRMTEVEYKKRLNTY